MRRRKRYDIKTLSIDKVPFDKGTFICKNHEGDVHQKLVPDPFLILVNKLKQSLLVRYYFNKKIF